MKRLKEPQQRSLGTEKRGLVSARYRRRSRYRRRVNLAQAGAKWAKAQGKFHSSNATARTDMVRDCGGGTPTSGPLADPPGAEPEVVDLRGGKTVNDHLRERDGREPRRPPHAA